MKRQCAGLVWKIPARQEGEPGHYEDVAVIIESVVARMSKGHARLVAVYENGRPGNHEVEITLIEVSQGGSIQVRGTVGIRGKWNAGSAHRARDE